MFNKAAAILSPRLLYLISLSLFLSVGNIMAQQVKCDTKKIKIREFKADSLYTFNNQFVRAGGLPNIKNSKNPLELRMYVVGAFGNAIITTIIGDGHALKVTKKELWLAGARRLKKEDVITKGQMEAHIKSIANCTSHQCSLIDTLVKNDLFVMSSSKRDEFKRNSNPWISDSGSIVTFEIKVGNKIRNFEYPRGQHFDDLIAGRAQKMQAIFDVFESIVKE